MTMQNEQINEKLTKIEGYAEEIIRHCMEVYGKPTGYGKRAQRILKCAKETQALITIEGEELCKK